MDRLAIVGVAQTTYEECKKDKTCYDLVYEATGAALRDAGLTLADIDNVVTVSNDFLDGRTISGMPVGEAAGAHDKNISTVSGDGAFGAFYGAMRVLGGFETTLVVAHSKGSEYEFNTVTNGMFDPIYQRLLGIEAISASALQCCAYMEKYSLNPEDFARVAVKNHTNARKNPLVGSRLSITIDDVLRSQPLADPLKQLDCSRICDGAAAIIISSERAARRARTKPVWVKGVAHCADAYFIGDRDLADPKALRFAAKKAFQMAGVTNPSKEIDVVELSDAFSYMEPLWLEGLGLCAPGRGAAFSENGTSALSGILPVNPSGGVLPANVVLVAGLARIIEAALQIRGEAGEHQVQGVQTALAHGVNGPCGQSHCVWVLSGKA
ncbi:MAG: thiolase family protein [Pseudomonadota bacterium]